MAKSDRSRSPLPSRNRLEPRGQAPPLPSELPFFPRWCGPMNASVRHFQNMSRRQNRPNWPMNPSGPYMMGECGHRHHSIHHRTGNLSNFHRLHQHNRALQAHLPSLHLSLGPTPLLIQTHRPGTETMRQPESMGSTKTLMGKRTGITMTIKKSMASLSLDQFDNRLLLKSWTSRDVTLCHSLWQPCCISKPTITGFESWLMVVNSTFFYGGYRGCCIHH